MGKVIMFPFRAEPKVDQIDLLTAVDVALHDLWEIAQHSTDPIACERADECRRMLESAFQSAVR